jgi:hypothetical protein
VRATGSTGTTLGASIFPTAASTSSHSQ